MPACIGVMTRISLDSRINIANAGHVQNVRSLCSAWDRARHGIAGPRSRLQAIAGEPLPGFCDLKPVGGREQFDFRQEQIADGVYFLDVLHMLSGTIDDNERIIYINDIA